MGVTALIAMIDVVVIIFSLMIAVALVVHFISVMLRWKFLQSFLFHRCDSKVAHYHSFFSLILLLLPVLLSSRRCSCFVVVVMSSCGSGGIILLSLEI